MPKIRNDHSRPSTSASVQHENKFIVFTDGKRRVLLTRTILKGSFDDALDVLSGHFPSIPRDRMTLQTDKLEACDGAFVDIPRESWSEVLPHLYSVMLVEGDLSVLPPALITPSPPSPVKKMTVTVQNTSGKRVELELKSSQTLVSSVLSAYCSHMKADFASTNLYNGTTLLPRGATLASQSISEDALLTAKTGSPSSSPSKQKFTVYLTELKSDGGGEEKYGFMVSSNTPLSSIRSAYMARFFKGNPEEAPQFLTSDSARMDINLRVADYDLHDGDEIILMKPQCGGKPVIYLFSPASIQASVRLSLIKEWAFSAIYPVVPIKTYPPVGQTLQWHVQTHPDGTLTEHSTNLRTSYLFWEAETQSDRHRPLSPPPSPSAGPVFNPVHSTVTDLDSVVLPVTQITPYLDAALTALSLHVEARTSFITYWLPSILKHTHIALRFVPQAAYNKAAPLEVTPQPDVLTRIFMLWKGVTSAELRSGVWQNSVQRASMDVEMWKGIVGIQEFPSMYDESVFRVLEWGGMEVHKS